MFPVCHLPTPKGEWPGHRRPVNPIVRQTAGERACLAPLSALDVLVLVLVRGSWISDFGLRIADYGSSISDCALRKAVNVPVNVNGFWLLTLVAAPGPP